MADERNYEPRLKSDYREPHPRRVMKEKFAYTNEMQIPKLDKIVLNMGIGEAVNDSKKVNAAIKDLDGDRRPKARDHHPRPHLHRRLQAARRTW